MSQLAEFRARLKTPTGNYIDCAISLAADAAAGGFSETIIPAVEHALFVHNIGLSDTIASREKVKEELCYLKTITFGVAASQADDISFTIDSGKRAIVVKFKSVSVRKGLGTNLCAALGLGHLVIPEKTDAALLDREIDLMTSELTNFESSFSDSLKKPCSVGVEVANLRGNAKLLAKPPARLVKFFDILALQVAVLIKVDITTAVEDDSMGPKFSERINQRKIVFKFDANMGGNSAMFAIHAGVFYVTIGFSAVEAACDPKNKPHNHYKDLETLLSGSGSSGEDQLAAVLAKLGVSKEPDNPDLDKLLKSLNGSPAPAPAPAPTAAPVVAPKKAPVAPAPTKTSAVAPAVKKAPAPTPAPAPAPSKKTDDLDALLAGMGVSTDDAAPNLDDLLKSLTSPTAPAPAAAVPSRAPVPARAPAPITIKVATPSPGANRVATTPSSGPEVPTQEPDLDALLRNLTSGDAPAPIAQSDDLSSILAALQQPSTPTPSSAPSKAPAPTRIGGGMSLQDQLRSRVALVEAEPTGAAPLASSPALAKAKVKIAEIEKDVRSWLRHWTLVVELEYEPLMRWRPSKLTKQQSVEELIDAVFKTIEGTIWPVLRAKADTRLKEDIMRLTKITINVDPTNSIKEKDSNIGAYTTNRMKHSRGEETLKNLVITTNLEAKGDAFPAMLLALSEKIYEEKFGDSDDDDYGSSYPSSSSGGGGGSSGGSSSRVCSSCGGTKTQTCSHCRGAGSFRSSGAFCNACKGKGTKACYDC